MKIADSSVALCALVLRPEMRSSAPGVCVQRAGVVKKIGVVRTQEKLS